MHKKLILLILPVLFSLSAAQTRGIEVDTVVYKRIDSVQLTMRIFKPYDWAQRERIPCIVLFFGGGWNSGTQDQFVPQARELAELGMIVVLPDYRVGTRHGTTPFESVADAKSAMRYIRGHCALLHVDVDKIAAGGGSAGGHLAAAAASVAGCNNYGDDLRIEPRPDALVLFNPVVDNSPSGYGYERFGVRYMEISPLHNVRPGFPPSLVMLGSMDKLIPVATIEEFKRRIEIAGGICRLKIYEGQQHGFFNKNENSDEYYRKTLDATIDFLKSLEYITDLSE